ncbi:MAG: Type 1 glutamine amidotransferase-like domain-containing protein [Burkholderiales bacterium]|nr:Type 1 glutamine amidotransferase-like domain-containing protein [Burkholderiales bacterium]
MGCQRTNVGTRAQRSERRGVLMAGVSAGANVWLDHALSDSGGMGLQSGRGIGLFAGSCCPHYSIEPQRPPAFMACIAGAALPDDVAIDDGVAVLVDGQVMMRTFSAREGAGAYKLRRSGQAAVWAPPPQAITP